MQMIGHGAQYKVTTDGKRVFKTLNTLDEAVKVYKRWGYGLTRDLKGRAAKTLHYAEDSVQNLRVILEKHPELYPSLANPIIDDSLGYSQDKVTVFGKALQTSSRSTAKSLIDQYVDLHLYFARYGFADYELQVGVNYGVDKNGKVVLIDLGELTFDKKRAFATAAGKKWRTAETYWAPPMYPQREAVPWSLKLYYRKQMLTRFTLEAIEENWLQAAK